MVVKESVRIAYIEYAVTDILYLKLLHAQLSLNSEYQYKCDAK